MKAIVIAKGKTVGSEFLEEKVNEGIRERSVIGFLDLFILGVLARKQSVSACDLMECAKQKLGFSLNADILYSQLFYLEQKELVCSSSIGNNKVYNVTRIGKERINRAKENKSAVMWVIDKMLEG